MSRPKNPHLRVDVLARPEDDPRIIGFNAVANRLPTMMRWPGEPLRAFLNRAGLAATDGPNFCVAPIFNSSNNSTIRSLPGAGNAD